MKSLSDLQQSTLYEILELLECPKWVEDQIDVDHWENNQGEIDAWRKEHRPLSVDQLIARLDQRMPSETLLAMEVWSGSEFLAILSGWPLRLGAWLSDNLEQVEADAAIKAAAMHLSRSSQFGLSDDHPPSEWLDWARKRRLPLSEELERASRQAAAPDPRSVKSLQAMVLAMAKDKYGYGDEKRSQSTATRIADAAHREGLRISDETIRRHLREAETAPLKRLEDNRDE